MQKTTLFMFGIGSKIRHFRELKGYSQEDMAKLIGVNLKTYSNLERDTNKKVDLEKINKIAEVLGKDVLELITHNEKITFINGDHSNNSNHFNLYPSEQALTHEIEKLQIQLTAQRQEIEHLKEINALLKEKKA